MAEQRQGDSPTLHPRGRGKSGGSQRRPASTGRTPRRERSAGILVYHDDASATPPVRRFLLLDYGRHWDYPKGHLRRDEEDRDAAQRELAEETGIRDARLVDGFSHTISYRFHSGTKGPIHKEVIFFVARATSQRVELSHEHVGYEWLEREEALARVTFDNARDILQAASQFLDEHDPLPEG